MQRVVDAPAGFINSLKYTNGTGAAPAVGEFNQLAQPIEGNNIADASFGTASAKTITVSFWVKSSLTGTFGFVIDNSPGTPRNYIAQYTINVANTWEYKTAAIPGDTTATWATGNTAGMRVLWDLGSGTNTEGTANVWSANNYRRVSGNVQVTATTSATWQVTGVQLEIGNAATEFERRPFGQELALCQRYYATSIETGKIVTDFATLNASGVGGIVGFSTAANGDLFVPIRFPVSLRSNPTLTVYSGANRTAGSVRDMTTGTDITGFSNGGATSNNQGISYITGSTLTANRAYGFHYVASAEY
jgi:hypothetical protein